MNCSWEERVALDMGGDLDAAESRRVAEHLRTCAECRELAGELRADQELLRAMPEVDAGALRARVMRQIGARRRAWPYAIAAALVLALLAGTLVSRVLLRPVPLPRVAYTLPAAPALLPVTTKARTVRPAPRPRPASLPDIEAALAALVRPERGEPVRAAAAPPVEIRLQTSDPNVVIILVPETKGEANE